jgi:hypothetical protein
MRPWLPLSLVLVSGCVHRPVPADPVDQEVKARYWHGQAAQRQPRPEPGVRVMVRKPEHMEDGALRVSTTQEIILPRQP